MKAAPFCSSASLTAAGTNRQFLNGSPVPLVGLKSVGNLLVDVHGPHDHQSLLATEKQTELLDAYGKLGAFARGLREGIQRVAGDRAGARQSRT